MSKKVCVEVEKNPSLSKPRKNVVPLVGKNCKVKRAWQEDCGKDKRENANPECQFYRPDRGKKIASHKW